MPTIDHEKIRTLALMWGAELGPVGFRRLTARFGSTSRLLDAMPAELSDPALRLTADQIPLILGLTARLDEFERELADLRHQNIIVALHGEPEYPRLLSDLRDAPIVVCIAGRVLPLDDPAIALVGTRTPTPDGLAMSRALGDAFARLGTTVVSGLARGCDTAAHQGALGAGGRTIAVIGSGILRISPRENLDLARVISEKGAVISEQPPHADALAWRLMARNRLQSALSRGVIVVQARETGGALETARRAVEQNRRLYAVPWPAGLAEGLGNASLLHQGAEPLAGSQAAPAVRVELVDHLHRLASTQPARPQLSLFEQGAPDTPA